MLDELRKIYEGEELAEKAAKIPQIIDDSDGIFGLLNGVATITNNNGGKFSGKIKSIYADRETNTGVIKTQAQNNKSYTYKVDMKTGEFKSKAGTGSIDGMKNVLDTVSKQTRESSLWWMNTAQRNAHRENIKSVLNGPNFDNKLFDGKRDKEQSEFWFNYHKKTKEEKEKLNVLDNSKFNKEGGFYNWLLDMVDDNGNGNKLTGEYQGFGGRSEEEAQMLMDLVATVDNIGYNIGVKLEENNIPGIGKIRVSIVDTGLENSFGEYDTLNDTITLFRGKDKEASVNSLSGILMHEFVHAVTEIAMKADHRLAKKLVHVQKQVMQGLSDKYNGEGWKALLPDDITEPTVTQINEAKDLFQYISGSVSEFLAYSQTHVKFKKEANDVKIKSNTFKLFNAEELAGKKGVGVVFKKIANILMKVINDVLTTKNWSTIDKNGELSNKAGDLIQGVMNLAVIHTLQAKGGQDVTTNTSVIKYSDWGLANLGGLVPVTQEFKNMDVRLHKVLNVLDGKMEVMTNKLSKATHGKFQPFVDKMLDIKMFKMVQGSRIFTDIITPIIQDTSDKSVSWFYRAFRINKSLTDVTAKNLKNGVYKVVKELVKETNEHDRIMMTKALEADWTALGMIATDTAELYTDDKKREKMIKELTAKINNKSFTTQAAALGYWMMHKEAKLSLQATNINDILVGESEVQRAIVHDDLNKLATLYAIHYSDNKKEIGELFSKHPEAIERVSELYDVYRQRETVLLGDLSSSEAKGGLIKEHDEPMTYKVITEKEYNEGNYSKYRDLAGNPARRYYEGEEIAGEKLWLITEADWQAGVTKGAINNISMTDRKRSVEELGPKTNTQRGNDESTTLVTIQKAKHAHKEELAGLASSDIISMNQMMNISNKLTPIRNKYNRVVNFELGLKNSDNAAMVVDNDIIKVMGATLSRIGSKEQALQNNMIMIGELVKRNSANVGKKGYMKLEPHSEDKEIDNLWMNIPTYVRKHIEQYAPEGLWIDRRFATNLIGYKDPSIENLTIGDWSIDKIPKAKKALRKIELFWTKLVSRYKEIIVKYLPSTVFGNAQSNMWIAMRHGVDPIEYANGFIRGWTDLTKYIEDQEELGHAKLKKDAGLENQDAVITRLEAELERNPMRSLVKDGQFSEILEDISVGVTHKSTHEEAIAKRAFEKMIGKMSPKSQDKARDAMSNMLKYAYATKDSSAAQIIEKMTSFNDIVNRKIIEDRMLADLQIAVSTKTIPKNATVIAEKKQGIRDYLDQLFVNYSYLDNRMIKYANDVGILQFTKFFMRALKAEAKMIKRNPMAYLTFEAIDIGMIDLEDAQEQYLDIGKSLDRKFMNVGPADVTSAFLEPVFVQSLTR
jgi:hypothetical protein